MTGMRGRALRIGGLTAALVLLAAPMARTQQLTLPSTGVPVSTSPSSNLAAPGPGLTPPGMVPVPVAPLPPPASTRSPRSPGRAARRADGPRRPGRALSHARLGRDQPPITGGLVLAHLSRQAGPQRRVPADQGGAHRGADIPVAARRLHRARHVRPRAARSSRCSCARKPCARCSTSRPAASASKAASATPASRPARSISTSIRAASSNPATSGRWPRIS